MCGGRSLHLFLVHLLLVLSGGILVLLVLRDEIVHVGLGFSEFHLVHTLTGVPVEEGLSSEHGGELLSDTLEHLLDGGGVSEESDGHLESLGGDIANGGLDVVGDPLNEVRRVLVLDVQELFVNLLARHASTEKGGGSQVTTVTGIGSAHHVLGIPHLLGQLGDGKGTVLLRSTGGQWSETNHEEVKTWERNQVNSKFSQVRVQLTWETDAASDTRHSSRDQVVKVTVGWGGELQGTEADIVKSFVIQNHNFVGVFDKLVDGKGSVVWLNDGIRDLW
jgi:hypothetical protein